MNDLENEMGNVDKDSFVRRNAIWLVVILAFVIFGFLLFKGWDKILNDEIDGMVTITGNFSCLPIKEGVEVSETCALGVRSQDGLYYALDISRIQDANSDLRAEDTIAVTGTFLKPKIEEPEPEWINYDVAGVILVNTLLHTR